MFFEKLIENLFSFLKEQGFVKKDGLFVNNEKEIRVVYNSEKKLYELYFKDGNAEKLISSYLFDETQTENDIEAVAIDFIDTLKGVLGVKEKRVITNVELPDEFNGDKITIGGFTQKLLAVFPAHKEDYKAHVAKYGKFLPVDFSREFFIPSIKNLLETGNKRQIKKFYDLMCDMYIAADSETLPLIVAVLSSVVYAQPQRLAELKEQTKQCTSLYAAVFNFTANMKHSKKLRECL